MGVRDDQSRARENRVDMLPRSTALVPLLPVDAVGGGWRRLEEVGGGWWMWMRGSQLMA